MRLSNGVVIDKEKTFGELKFTAVCDVFLQFPYNAVVELVNPVADTVSRKNYTGADVDWYVNAKNIVLKNKNNQNVGNPQNHIPQGQLKNRLAE